jgi:hypothetical protein
VGIYDEIAALEAKYGVNELMNALLKWYWGKWKESVEGGVTYAWW